MSATRLEPEHVLRIDALLKLGNKPKAVAALVAAEGIVISAKSIERIQRGVTWSTITHNSPPNGPSIDSVLRFANPSKRMRALQHGELVEGDAKDTCVAVGNHLGFEHTLPWFWGRFRAWDGTFAVVTDGRIAWISEKLACYFADLGKAELPTFQLAALFSHPIEHVLTPNYTDGRWRLVYEDTQVCLHERYVFMAKKHNLTIYRAGEQTDFVFLATANKRDLDPSIHACVVTETN